LRSLCTIPLLCKKTQHPGSKTFPNNRHWVFFFVLRARFVCFKQQKHKKKEPTTGRFFGVVASMVRFFPPIIPAQQKGHSKIADSSRKNSSAHQVSTTKRRRAGFVTATKKKRCYCCGRYEPTTQSKNKTKKRKGKTAIAVTRVIETRTQWLVEKQTTEDKRGGDDETAACHSSKTRLRSRPMGSHSLARRATSELPRAKSPSERWSVFQAFFVHGISFLRSFACERENAAALPHPFQHRKK